MNPTNRSPLGCLYTGWLGLVCTVLLVFNFEIVRALLDITGSREINAKAAQVVQFFAPIALIVIEFWIYDLLSDRAEYYRELEQSTDRDR